MALSKGTFLKYNQLYAVFPLGISSLRALPGHRRQTKGNLN